MSDDRRKAPPREAHGGYAPQNVAPTNVAPPPEAEGRWTERPTAGCHSAEAMSDDGQRVEKGWGPTREERGIGPGAKPPAETPPPPKPNDAATSGRPAQSKPDD